ATAILHALTTQEAAAEPPAPHDIEALRAQHGISVEGDDLRHEFDERGIQYGRAFAGLSAAYVAGDDSDSDSDSDSDDDDADTVLAEVAVPSSIRSQQGAYVVHPALLDACFQSVAAHPGIRDAAGLLLPLGVGRIRSYGPARHAHYCLTTVTRPDSGAGELSADIDVLDEHGAVLLTVRGLRLGTGAPAGAERDRLLDERLLTIEWREHELPDTTATEPGNWLLINVTDTTESSGTCGIAASRLVDALKSHDALSTAMPWPRSADYRAEVGQLRDLLNANVFDGVVVLTDAGADVGEGAQSADGTAVRGREAVEQIVRIGRELSGVEGLTTRLYVVTRNAQKVLGDDDVNLDHGGLRGLLRVISAEEPHLKPTYIDVDEHTDAEQVARQLLLAESGEDETAWRNGDWYTARLCPTPLGPDDRRTTVVDHECDGMRLQIRTPGDLQTLELTAFDRVPPGPGEVEVAVQASSINFADVLVTFGRYQTADGQQPQLGTDFAGVVTAVGSGVADLNIGDRVGGLSPHGCWSTFVTCDARLATVLPEGLTDVEAAAVSTASATAWYGLQDLARIRAGDKVLIHSGTGGVGQAAIAIARAAGAQIYATAGSDKRRQV
ncbi:polyketide synthase dehydratase domain-containing protein, partial [Mycobacterium sp.]|uniref:polyketide synthase dehydratase domain-containing protein n=1 Tax=Mycobacterium sp. TaxID=1785 RepID=UPI003A884AA3